MADICTGYYVEVYNDVNDVILIINEPNDEPSITEVSLIEAYISNYIYANPGVGKSLTSQYELQQALDALDLNCLGYGFRLIFADGKGGKNE